jgi:hypothetical protein
MFQVRKCRQYNVIESSDVITFDPNSFRQLGELSFTGETEEEFLNSKTLENLYK